MTSETTKARSDAWDAALSDVQRWQAYARFRTAPWHEVAEWAKQEFALPRVPSRPALYRWAARMRALESAHRIEQAIMARDEAATLAGAAAPDDAQLIEAYKAMAADQVMRGADVAQAMRFTKMALSLGDALRKRQELDLKARAQETKDEALRLAREKFEAAEARLTAIRAAVTEAHRGGLSAETLKKIETAAGIL